ncbi:phage tail tape measure protein [Donghicola sp. XS_ASV15]|uniref:phage tail tape measure protein n=1 Tax=Donghicola sp. XS_ASV15 TaxID=3241295 RepID=UPI003512329B
MDSIFNLSVIIAAVDNLTGPVREMVRSMEGLDRMAARGREMQDWGTRMSIAGAMTQGAANQMMAAINGPIEAAAQFEQSMALVRAVTTNITGDEFEALSAQARELGATTAFSASQAAEGMGFLARAGFDAQEQMAAMPSMLALARAGAVDLGTTADIASNILSGFGLDAAEMTRVADVMVATFTTANTDIPMLGDTMRYIAPVARAAGMSLEEAAAMAGLLGNAGIQSSQAGTTLRAMLQRLAAPSREAAAALDAMGVSVADEQGNMRSMVTILGEVGDAIGDLGTQQQLDIIGTIFGVEAAAGAAELLAQGQSIGDYVDQLMASQGRAAQVAAEMGDNFRGAQTEFASAMEGLNITLGTMLLPVLTDVARAATGVVQSIMGWAEANPTIAGIALRAALLGAGVLAVVAPILSVVGGFAMMAGVGLQVLSRIGIAFVWLLPKIWAATGGIFMFGARLVTVAAAAIPSFISGLMAMGAAAAGRVVAGLRAAAVAARAFGLALMANPIGLAVAAIAAGALLVWYYWEPISEFFVDLWADVQTAFEGFSSWVSSWWSRVTGWLAQGLDWARMIPSLSWADFVGLLTWENFLTVLNWLSWLIPLRWLDFIPGFSWSAVIGAVLDWADWISSLSWSEFVALFTWDNALQVLDWVSWVSPLRWLDFIPGFSWSEVIGSALAWGDWVTSLDWSSYMPAFTWSGALTALDWASWILPIRWLDFIPGFSWAGVIGSALAWGDWVTSLDWSSYIPAFSWSEVLSAIGWGLLIGVERLRASWQAVRDFLGGIEWSSMLPEFDWGDIIPDLRPALDAILGPGADAPLLDQLSFVRAGDGFFYGWSEGVELVNQYRQGLIGLEELHERVSGEAGTWTSTGSIAQRLQDIIEASAEFQAMTGQTPRAQIVDPQTLAEAEAAASRLAEMLPRIDAAAAQTRAAVGAELTAVQSAVSSAVQSVTSVLAGVSLRSHGIAFMRTLAEGIRAGAAQAIEATRETVQAMRDHLPHSPAKIGPLSDLDRVRFSETVAGAVRPAPAVAAVHRLTAGMAAALAGATMSLPAMAAQVPEIGRTNLPVLQAASAMPQVGLTGEPGSAPAMAANGVAGGDAGTRVEINFNPNITMQGGAGGGDGFQSREQMQELLRSMGHELVQLVQDELARQSRRDY